MLRLTLSRALLVIATATACDDANEPTAPIEAPGPQLSKTAQSFTRDTYAFTNLTGHAVSRLVVTFNATVTDVPFATFQDEVSGATVELFDFALPALQQAELTAMVEAKTIRILNWYWADANGTTIGEVNKGCNARHGCAEAPTPNAIYVITPPTEIPAGQEISYCYYFRTRHLDPVHISKFTSEMLPGVQRMSLVFTDEEIFPPGTQSAANCSLFSVGSPRRVWAYTAYTASAEYTFPGDDGSGRPVGLLVPPAAHGFVHIFFKNTTAQTLTANVTLRADLHDAGVDVTPASSFVAYNGSISIPSGSTSDIETETCTVPAGAKFFYMSTYAHQQMVHAYIRDGATTVFEATDPDAPGAATWSAPPFFTFTTGQLTYSFEYVNPSNRTITAGPSTATDELAVALTYFFPSAGGLYCFNSIGPI